MQALSTERGASLRARRVSLLWAVLVLLRPLLLGHRLNSNGDQCCSPCLVPASRSVLVLLSSCLSSLLLRTSILDPTAIWMMSILQAVGTWRILLFLSLLLS